MEASARLEQDNVVPVKSADDAELSASAVLHAALKRPLESVLVVATEQDGTLYFAASSGDAREQLWLARMFEHELMRTCSGDDE